MKWKTLLVIQFCYSKKMFRFLKQILRLSLRVESYNISTKGGGGWEGAEKLGKISVLCKDELES